MKTKLAALLPLAAALLLTGCGTHSELLDPSVEKSVEVLDTDDHTLDDNRLEVTAKIRNRENRRIEVQVNCVFMDGSKVPTGDETPFQALILTENATETVRFTSMNSKAKRYVIRVRQVR
ncbi:MAG: hypothetical protein QM813_25265 [Verrucomicrobiota bacterium]